MSPSRLVSLDDAIQITGLSRSTVLRHLKDGSLQGQKVHGKWQISITDAPEPSYAEPAETVDTVSARVELLTQENEHLTQRVNELTGERDYLRNALAAALTLQQKALPAPRSRPWWKVWERREPGEG